MLLINPVRNLEANPMKIRVSRLALFAAILFLPGINHSHAGTYTVTALPSPPGACKAWVAPTIFILRKLFDAPSALNNFGPGGWKQPRYSTPTGTPALSSSSEIELINGHGQWSHNHWNRNSIHVSAGRRFDAFKASDLGNTGCAGTAVRGCHSACLHAVGQRHRDRLGNIWRELQLRQRY